ncbi:MAG TPA: MFS transporter [Polyangiaceae bacterium]|nr:MFS transporter [Polyangiaceae bacterium]
MLPDAASSSAPPAASSASAPLAAGAAAPLPVRSIAFLAAAAFASAANLRISDPLLPQVAGEFGVGAGAASIIVTSYTVAYGAMQVVYGPIGDRVGKYRVAALTTFVAALATLGCAAAPSLVGLAIARFLTAAAACAVIPLALAWIGDVVPFDQRQPVLSRFISGQIAGMVVGQAAGGVLGDRLGWRAVFVALAGVHLLAGLALVARMRVDPLTRRGGVAGASLDPLVVVRQFAALLRRPWVAVIVATVGLEGTLFFGAFAYVGSALRHRFQLSFTLVGLVLASYGVGGLAYTLGARRMLARWGERGLVRRGGALMALGFASLAFAPRLPPVVLGIAASGLGFYMLHNTLQSNATQMAPEQRGVGIALFAATLFVGQSLGVAVAAPVVDRWGEAPIFVGAALGLLALAFYFSHKLSSRPA